MFTPNNVLEQGNREGTGRRRDLVVGDVRRCTGWTVDGALCLLDVGRCLAATTADDCGGVRETSTKK